MHNKLGHVAILQNLLAQLSSIDGYKFCNENLEINLTFTLDKSLTADLYVLSQQSYSYCMESKQYCVVVCVQI